MSGYAEAIAVGSAMISKWMADGDEARAREVRDQIVKEIGETRAPELDKLVADQLPESLRDRYTAATQATTAQGDALRALQNEVSQNGETAEDRAAYIRSGRETSKQAAGANSAVLRQLGNRGLAGSGIEAALMAGSGQAAVEHGAMANADAAADARRRKLAAMASLGSLANGARGQEINALGAQDEISKFNARQRADAQRHNVTLSQAAFENRMRLMGMKHNAMTGQATDLQEKAQNTRQDGAAFGALAMGFDDEEEDD